MDFLKKNGVQKTCHRCLLDMGSMFRCALHAGARAFEIRAALATFLLMARPTARLARPGLEDVIARRGTRSTRRDRDGNGSDSNRILQISAHNYICGCNQYLSMIISAGRNLYSCLCPSGFRWVSDIRRI